MTGKDKLEDYNAARRISSSLVAIPRLRSLDIATGVLLLILSLLFYYGTVLRVQFSRTDFLDLGPYPDAVEYFAQANSILKEGAPTIQIGYDKLPSRYPPGYPLLMIPWLSFLPHNGILAPFRTNQTIGLLLLAGSFVFYVGIGRPLAGGLATLLLATQPAFITFSRSSMSDLSAGAVTVLAFALVYLGLAWRRRWLIYSAAFVLGLSLCIRPQLLFMAPLLIAMALFPANVSWTRWFMHCCLALVVFAIATSPYFILNTLEFGHPLKTGYEFWVPALADKQAAFSLHNVPPQVALIWSEITASWDQFRVANLFGTGTYVVPAFIFLSMPWSALRTSAAVRNQRIFSRNCLLCGDRNLRLRRRAGSTCLFFSSWLRSPFCLRNGQWAKLSGAAFRSWAWACWQYSCSAVSVIRHNQALSPRVVDHKPGTLFITQMTLENHPDTRRRRNSFASPETHLALFYPTSILPI